MVREGIQKVAKLLKNHPEKWSSTFSISGPLLNVLIVEDKNSGTYIEVHHERYQKIHLLKVCLQDKNLRAIKLERDEIRHLNKALSSFYVYISRKTKKEEEELENQTLRDLAVLPIFD